LRDVLQKKNAAIGIFITLEKPTSEMIKEMKETDPYVSPRWKEEYPRIQILIIESFLEGQKPKMPRAMKLFKEAPIEIGAEMSKQITLS